MMWRRHSCLPRRGSFRRPVSHKTRPILHHPRLITITAITCVLLASCSAPARPPQPAKAEAPAPPAQKTSLDLNAIFPPGPGRELVLNNCTTCHTFVPIVILQMTKEAWQRNSRDHRGRVTALSDADFKTLYQYLQANFNPSRPVPKLPPELLETWTAY
jgi:mono/diheme cytochrome c family protein